MSSTSDLIPWEVEPPSSNTVFKVSYLIKDPPTIYTVPIKVTSGTDRQAVLSQRLRREAILDFTKKHLTRFENNFAIQFWTEKDENNKDKRLPLDRLLLSPGAESVTDLYEIIERASKGDNLLSTVKWVKDGNGQLKSQSVFCAPGPVQTVTREDGQDDYWKMLDILGKSFIKTTKSKGLTYIRAGEMLLELEATPPTVSSQSHARATSGRANGVVTAPTATKEFTSPPHTPTKVLPNTPTKRRTPKTSVENSVKSSTLASVPITIKDTPKVSPLFQIKTKLDPNQEKLHVELDMVPGIKKDLLLSELILDIFGCALSGPEIHHHLSHIRGILTGLVVSKAYQPPIARGLDVTDGQITGADLSNSNFTRTSPGQAGGRESQAARTAGLLSNKYAIRDVQLAKDVPSFLYTDGKRYLCSKVFQRGLRHCLEIQKTIQHLNLPLAKIGPSAWVPLEMLKVHHTQTLPSSTLSVGLPQDFMKSSKGSGDVRNSFQSAAESITKKLPWVKHETQDVKRFTKQKPVPAEVSTRGPLQTRGCKKLSIGLIYVAPTASRCQDAAEFTANVDRRLRAPGQKLNSRDEKLSQILKFDEDFYSSDPPTAIVPDVKPLLLADSRGETSVHAFRARKPNTIFAIIDADGRTKTEVRNIRAELHKFGNRKIGALTYCTTRQSLEKLFSDHKATPGYFPIGILLKLHTMHGGQNFSLKPLSDTALMTVGAHISHPGPEASQHCPSVASVVSTLDPNSTTFPGSVRLQPTLRSVETKNSRLVHHVESRMLQLEDMMVERCLAWKARPESVAPRVIFYRDGLNIVQKNAISSEIRAVVEQEMQAILSAINKVFATDTPSLTYILVNKGIDSPYGSDMKTTMEKADIITFPRGNYKYFIMPTIGNEIRMKKDVCKLTTSINATYQLDQTATPSVALPVHYAQKLAVRMFDYFRFAVTNEYDTVSSVLRRMKYPATEAEKNDQESTEVIKEYLFGGPSNNSRSNETSDSDVSHRKNPWPESLDETMFYL